MRPMSKVVVPNPVYQVSNVSRLMNVDRRTVWRFYREFDPETGEKHPFGAMMWLEDRPDRRQCWDEKVLVIDRDQFMAYLAKCRYGDAKPEMVEFIPLWGISEIARKANLPRYQLETAFHRAQEGDPDAHPFGHMMWRDPYWMTNGGKGKVGINYLEMAAHWQSARDLEAAKTRRRRA